MGCFIYLGQKKSYFSITFSENEEGRGGFFFSFFFLFRNLWKVPNFHKNNRTWRGRHATVRGQHAGRPVIAILRVNFG